MPHDSALLDDVMPVRERKQVGDIFIDHEQRQTFLPEFFAGVDKPRSFSSPRERDPRSLHRERAAWDWSSAPSQWRASAAPHRRGRPETKADAEKAFDLFLKTYEPKYPKATLCLHKDREELMAFYDFPAQHWQSIRTSNPIESTFATIRHRTKRSKGCLTRDGMLHMMFKLGQCAQENWRRLRGFAYLAKVITGVKFRNRRWRDERRAPGTSPALFAGPRG